MKEKKTNLLQVLARRALLVALDGAIVAFSFISPCCCAQTALSRLLVAP